MNYGQNMIGLKTIQLQQTAQPSLEATQERVNAFVHSSKHTHPMSNTKQDYLYNYLTAREMDPSYYQSKEKRTARLEKNKLAKRYLFEPNEKPVSIKHKMHLFAPSVRRQWA